MSANPDVLRHVQGLAQAALPDRQRRIAAVAGLNVLAVGLAFGALHITGAIVSDNRQQPLIAAVDPRGDTLAPPAVLPPHPHLAPSVALALAAVPDADVLFAAPLLPPTTFGEGSSSVASGGFVAAPPPAVAGDPPATTAPPPRPLAFADILPPVAKIVGLAERGRILAVDQLRRTTTPLVLIADNSLDVSAAVAGQAGIAGSADIGGSIGGNVAAPVAATAQATASVAHAVGSVTGALR